MEDPLTVCVVHHCVAEIQKAIANVAVLDPVDRHNLPASHCKSPHAVHANSRYLLWLAVVQYTGVVFVSDHHGLLYGSQNSFHFALASSLDAVVIPVVCFLAVHYLHLPTINPWFPAFLPRIFGFCRRYDVVIKEDTLIMRWITGLFHDLKQVIVTCERRQRLVIVGLFHGTLNKF